MGLKGFNEESEKPRFIHKKNPLAPHNWQIFQLKEGKTDYEPVGEYTLLDTREPIDITEKHVTNLIILLNGKTKLIDLRNLTNNRLLYNIVPTTGDSDRIKIILRSHDRKSVSKENAVLLIEKGVFDE